MLWRIKRWFNIWRGVECRKCHADLRRVVTCGFPDCPNTEAFD